MFDLTIKQLLKLPRHQVFEMLELGIVHVHIVAEPDTLGKFLARGCVFRPGDELMSGSSPIKISTGQLRTPGFIPNPLDSQFAM